MSLTRRRLVSLGRGCAGILVALLASSPGPARPIETPVGFDQTLAAAEESLKGGDTEAAERQYRDAAFEGWLLLGSLERLDGRLPAAREALAEAAALGETSPPEIRSLALALLRCDEADQAADLLAGLADADPRDVETRRLLSMVRSAQGRFDDAVRRLDEAVATRPDDPEVVFLLASEYLWLKRPDAAERLFADVVRARPIPQTHVLLGRAYRDAGEYARARAELEVALEMDPGVRRAHYYLGMVALVEGGTSPERFERAREELLEELKIAPEDPLTNDQLGAVLLEAGRPAEALPALEAAVRVDERAEYLAHLARALLALDRPEEAAAAARRGLERAGPTDGDEVLESLHFQLGRALRVLGEAEDAARHLAQAGRLAARRRAASAGSAALRRAPVEDPALAGLTPPQRLEAKRRVRAGLARAYFNRGVLAAQSQAPAVERFSRAAELFAVTARIDPGFPQVQPSLGIAHFNARHFEEATLPLTRALAENPGDAGLTRMLATAWLNSGAYPRAVELLRDDPERETNPAVGFAYGLALLRSGRLTDAAVQLETVARLVPVDPEVHFALGEAYEKLEKSDLAREHFEMARRLRSRP